MWDPLRYFMSMFWNTRHAIGTHVIAKHGATALEGLDD
jgi:hypothetical protein